MIIALSALLPTYGVAAGIHGEVGEAVGFFVVFAANVGDREMWDQGEPSEGIVIKQADAFVLHLILAFDLLHYQPGVGVNLKLLATSEDRERKAGRRLGA